MLKSYFNWLQKDVPTGSVEVYPELSASGETTQKGVYVAGDLTGLPLLKIAADGGAKLVREIAKDLSPSSSQDVYNILIIGAGPAGISAALECKEKGLNYLVVEASQKFNTIENFPKGKPILIRPNDFLSTSALKLEDGSKETLLEDLQTQIAHQDLHLQEGVSVQSIKREVDLLAIETKEKTFKAQKVILAIGKSGNARRLNIPGESLPKVFNKLYDPAEAFQKKVLVVGGGDSALETSIALAQQQAHVTHIYRQAKFARAKEENIQAFKDLVDSKAITVHYETEPLEIKEKTVLFKDKNQTHEIENDMVYTMIGRELPLAFFKRCGIRLQGEKDASTQIYLWAMVTFFSMLYFGKSGWAFPAHQEGILGYLAAPFYAPLSWGITGYAWYYSFNFIMGWLGAIGFAISGPLALFQVLKKKDHYFGSAWMKVKTFYFIFVATFFSYIYIKSHYQIGEAQSWIEGPTYWYSFLYCTTMALFAWRRAQVKKTTYVKRQMITLVSIQVFFLFLLPFHLYEPIVRLFPADSAVIKELFPWGKWTCFSFILLWPLSCWQFGTSTFWTIFPFFQTGLFLFWLVRKYGKGAYCGWICSCGGMAETLGDEYRHLAPHGPKAKSLENIGQYVLIFAVVVTFFSVLAHQGIFPKGAFLDTVTGLYKLSIDVFFAGVLGLGVYFYMGGRVWCRFGCPLAALMHIYTRFSKYRILAEKKKCISCNICTKVCHMGIDVMNYANKGVPMNDVECVRCSTCVTSCPMEVLSFDELTQPDVDNTIRKEVPDYSKSDWKAGIK